MNAGRRATTFVLALLAGVLVAAPAKAQPWARYAVPDSSLPAALTAGAANYEATWNALLVTELRARLARADSAQRLLDLAFRIARAEPGALGTRIGLDALGRRTVWSRAQFRQRVEAGVAESLGTAAENARQAATADSLYRAALTRYVSLGEKRRHAWVLGSMGRNAFGAGDLVYADSVYRQALAARQAIGDARMTGASWNALGSTAWQRGRYAEARDCYRQARAIRETTGERAALSQTLNFLGLAYRGLGEPDSARQAFGAALAINSALGDSARTLDVLVNLMDLLARFGEPDEVDAVAKRGIALARERSSVDREASLLINWSEALFRFGHYTEARKKSEQALAIARDAGQQLDALNGIGRVDLRLNDPAAARKPLERALALADSAGRAGKRALALGNLAIAARLEGDWNGAERTARQALVAAVEAGDSTLVEADLTTIGILERRRGDFRAAERTFERAAAIGATLGPLIHAADLNNWGTSMFDRPEEATRRFEQARQVAAAGGSVFEESSAMLNLGEVAERQGDDEAALGWARRAATLIDTTRSRLGSDRAAITLSSGWRYAFDALIHLLMKLDARMPGKGYAAEAFQWAERARARALLDLIARGGTARPLTLAEARAQVSDRKLALLEYSLGDSSTTLWAITRDAVHHYTLPGRAALAPRVEVLRRGLADPARATSRSTLVAARALHRELIEPALADLKGVDRVIVSPDGPLALVPFEALLAAEPREGRVPAARDWLGSRWAVSYAFSAATLAARSGISDGEGVLAIADPRFGSELPALPRTADEARSLEKLAAGQTSYAGLTGTNATRERFLDHSELRRAKLLHIATHGVADENEPDRSGLWLSADSTGRPGFLSVADVAALDLRADLVTLSACETGLGRLERGEGVVGLTRAFVGAGARSVVVSLWRVNDRSSALLMNRFYTALLAKGRPRDVALAEARRALLRSSETRSPFHWASFVLVGETGPLALGTKARPRS